MALLFLRSNLKQYSNPNPTILEGAVVKYDSRSPFQRYPQRADNYLHPNNLLSRVRYNAGQTFMISLSPCDQLKRTSPPPDPRLILDPANCVPLNLPTFCQPGLFIVVPFPEEFEKARPTSIENQQGNLWQKRISLSLPLRK